MPDRDSYSPGTPAWIDLGASDVDGAVAFYGGLFGWTATEPRENTGGYRRFLLDGKNVAGVMPLMQPEQPVAWSSYVSTDDADAVAERVKANGGQVLAGPMDVMELGRMAFFMDPAGAAIGVWQPNQFIGAETVNEPGTLNWNELATRDIDGAKAFYSAVFGWTVDDRDFGGGKYTIWQNNGEGVGGGMAMGDQYPPDVPPHWMVYFAAADVDASAEKAKELGGSVTVPPMDIPDVGRFAVISDPQGAVFSLLKGVQPEE
jgi:predicted enzyme related to lactoylglutathione lyase